MRSLVISLTILLLAAGTVAAQTAPTTFTEDFDTGSRIFDDAVGFARVRPSGSTAETDYAPGIIAPTSFYARLTVQPSNNINGDQIGPCTPGAAQTNNTFSCGGPLTEWGLPWAGFNGQFDTGIPIDQGGSATTSIEIYLDTAFAATAWASGGNVDYRFDWDSVLLDSQGSFLQDYVFNVATGQTGDSCAPNSGRFYVIEASNDYQRGVANAHNAKKTQPQSFDLAALVEPQQSQLAAGKAAYKMKDSIADQIARQMHRKAGPIPGANFVLVDNCRKLRKGTVYKPLGFRRWGIEEA